MVATRIIRVLLVGCASFLLTAGAGAAATFTPGSAGLGDPFFANAGNAGYDVANYDLKLAYDPATDVLDGKAVLTGTANGMTLQALREKVGDFTFNGILRDWATQNRYGNVTTPQFIAHAEQISGQDMSPFFDAWLYRVGKPTSW